MIDYNERAAKEEDGTVEEKHAMVLAATEAPKAGEAQSSCASGDTEHGWKMVFGYLYNEHGLHLEKQAALNGAVGAFAVLGCLARYWLQVGFVKLAVIPDSQYTALLPTILPNMVGCLVLGVLQGLRGHLQNSQPSVFVGIGTGFCGALTTFSTFNWELCTVVYNNESGVGFGIATYLFAITLMLTACWGSLCLGYSISERFPLPGLLREPNREPVEERDMHLLPKLLVYFSGWLAMLVILIVRLADSSSHIESWNLDLVVALAAAIPGALLRYQLAFFNHKHELPVWTLICNVSASMIAAALYLARWDGSACIAAETRRNSVLEGIEVGFCGALSTLSTYMNEVRIVAKAKDDTKNRSDSAFNAMLYCAGSIFLAQMAQWVLLGPYAGAKECGAI